MELFKFRRFPKNFLGDVKLPGQAFGIPIQTLMYWWIFGENASRHVGTYHEIFAGGGTRSPSKIASLNNGTYVSIIVAFKVCAVLFQIKPELSISFLFTHLKAKLTSYFQQPEK
jgi:hypothetical protein